MQGCNIVDNRGTSLHKFPGTARVVAFRHTRPGRLERPRGATTSAAHNRGSQDPYHSSFHFQPLSSKRRSGSFQVQARTNPTHHHGRPLYLILNEDSYFSSFFGRFFVSVRLPLFVYMSLNYVAILYKSLHVFASKYHPVLPLISVCSSSPSNSSLLSQLALSRPHSRPCSSFTVDLASQHLDVTRIGQQTSLAIPPVAHLLKLQE